MKTVSRLNKRKRDRKINRQRSRKIVRYTNRQTDIKKERQQIDRQTYTQKERQQIDRQRDLVAISVLLEDVRRVTNS